MTEKERKQAFEALLKEHFGVEDFPADAPPLVASERHHELAALLKKQGYTIYGFCVASHWPAVAGANDDEPGTAEHYEIATGLRSVGAGSFMAQWRVSVPIDQDLQTLADLFPGADWQEREQYDLVGVRFANHPDLRRLMMPEDWEGHPLRKDYAIDTACPPWR